MVVVAAGLNNFSHGDSRFYWYDISLFSNSFRIALSLSFSGRPLNLTTAAIYHFIQENSKNFYGFLIFHFFPRLISLMLFCRFWAHQDQAIQYTSLAFPICIAVGQWLVSGLQRSFSAQQSLAARQKKLTE